jgi:hypothetical protein
MRSRSALSVAAVVFLAGATDWTTLPFKSSVTLPKRDGQPLPLAIAASVLMTASRSQAWTRALRD